MAAMAINEMFYILHGSPTLSIDDSLPARPFLLSFKEKVFSQKPKSILVISGHWETSEPTINCIHGPNDTIYDFYGFPDRMYKLKYPAPGAPELAKRVKDLLMSSGIKQVEEDKERGLDHGAWVPLMLMYPEADILVCQLLVQTDRDGTHNLKDRGTFGAVVSWALDFDNWLKEALLNGR